MKQDQKSKVTVDMIRKLISGNYRTMTKANEDVIISHERGYEE